MVWISCPYHGFFRNHPYTHLRGAGCDVCNKPDTGTNLYLMVDRKKKWLKVGLTNDFNRRRRNTSNKSGAKFEVVLQVSNLEKKDVNLLEDNIKILFSSLLESTGSVFPGHTETFYYGTRDYLELVTLVKNEIASKRLFRKKTIGRDHLMDIVK
ncbi:hypothetical protein [Vibrio phage vB_pir03]|nr:hypothetical protein [Vibrio phage vB_pir03]